MQPFNAYFDEWIKAYYKSAKIGKSGDFYTSVSVSRFFGGAIANYILKNLESSALELPLNIVDIGANNLNLINDIYDFLDALSVGVVENCKFIALESNANLENIAGALNTSFDKSHKNATHKADKIQTIQHLAALNKLETNTFFIANEFFDALPCHLCDNNKIAFVRDDEIEFLGYKDLNPLDKKALEIAQNAGFIKGEIPSSYFDFCQNLAMINADSKKWIFCVFDYGDRAFSNDFSIRIYHKHDVFPLFGANPPQLSHFFGKSDITYNVPFALLDSAFECIGARNILYKPQDLALIWDFGILDLLKDFFHQSSNQSYIRESNKIKTLLNMRPFKCAIYKNH